MVLTPFVLTILLLTSCASAQEAPRPALGGYWSATTGRKASFRGRWWARAESPDAASGNWTLLDDANRIRLEGTWSARKSPRGWQGTWTAHADAGSALSGTWQADLDGFSGKTFEDMLKHTLEKQVSGSWRSGRYTGYWWLQGTKW